MKVSLFLTTINQTNRAKGPFMPAKSPINQSTANSHYLRVCEDGKPTRGPSPRTATY